MAQRPILKSRIKRSDAYENLISSSDTENDLIDTTFENTTNLEFDR
jgi:hypothetical protein